MIYGRFVDYCLPIFPAHHPVCYRGRADLFGGKEMNGQPDLFIPKVKTVLDHANEHSDILSAEFLEWLPDNLHVWDAFLVEAQKVIRRGYAHYSARTIIHVMRHHSAVSENGSEWKINNNHSPYFARLFDIIYPQHVGLWEYRTTTKKKGVKQ